MNAKDILYTGSCLQESEEAKKLYNRTHGLTDPGEQKNRNYDWKFDKNNHVFGRPEPIEFNGAKKSLNTDFLEASYPKTKIVDRRLEDYRQATADMIGKSKFRGTLHQNIDDSHVFGVKTVLGGNWNVAKCINGDSNEKTEKHFAPDSDLGKNVLYRSKMQALIPKSTIEPEKIFGLPSIRSDIQRNKTSICDFTVIL